MQQTEVPEPDVHPEFTAWLQHTINEKIERELQKNRSEVAITMFWKDRLINHKEILMSRYFLLAPALKT